MINVSICIMSANKSTICKSFNTLFFDFLTDILAIYPENKEMKFAKDKFELIRRGNPVIIIKFWKKYVYDEYYSQIQSGDIGFFLEKNYDEVLQGGEGNEKILSMIENVRSTIRSMDETNRAHSAQYLLNLSKLSEAYDVM
jgi:hypothetical protein